MANEADLRDVLLAEHVLVWLDVLGVLGDPDAATLTAALRLQDVRLVLLGARERLEVALTATPHQTDVRVNAWKSP